MTSLSLLETLRSLAVRKVILFDLYLSIGAFKRTSTIIALWSEASKSTLTLLGGLNSRLV